jgi:hypothetical protein
MRGPEKPEVGQSTKIDSLHSHYESFLSAMMYSDIPMGFRIQSINGKLKLLFITEQNKSEVFELSFFSQFSGFELTCRNDGGPFWIEEPVHTAAIQGVPKPTRNGLDGLVESMLQSGCPSLHQVWTSPVRPGLVSRKITEKKYSSALERAQKQDSYESWLRGKETITRYDVAAIRASKRYEAAYERINSEKLLSCRVVLASWNQENSATHLNMMLNTLRGTISHSDKKEQLKVKFHSGEKALRILTAALGMNAKVRGTQLLPRDVIPYFEIPHVEMGLPQGSVASFSTAGTERTKQDIDSIPFKPENIALGCTYRTGKLDSNRAVYLKVENLRRHAAILGMTGSRKSSTKNRIVIDAWKNGISSLLIEPVKLDTRNLLAAIDGLRVFTISRETVSPFRLNPFLIEPRVLIQGHIDQLYFAFLAAWPLYGILANHLRKVIIRTYRRNGWNILTDEPGRDVTIQDFRDEAERYSNELQYGSELRQDFKGAILTRVEELCDPSRAAIFNTNHNLPVSELLSHPTILELGHIKDPEFKALMLNLILYQIEQYFDRLGPADNLRSLILIDEAHRFLRELPLTLDMSEAAMSKRQVQDQLEDLTAEARSVGIGIIVLDQDPSQLSRRVLKNCHTKIVHRLESPDDVQLTALLTGCDKHQQAHICGMKEGEAILRGLNDSAPLNIQVFYDPQFISGMKLNWTDAEVKERMEAFYKGHPDFARTPEIPLLDSPEVILDRDLMALRVQIEDIVRSQGFQENYTECMDSTDAEEIHALEELIVFYSTHGVASDRPVSEVVETFIETLVAVYGNLPSSLSPNVLKQLVREYVKAEYNRAKRSALDGP